MCGGVKAPSLPNTPAPAPMPTPTDASAIQTEGERSRRISNLKRGILSTIKTSPQGTMGKGPELNTGIGQGKTTLGS